MFYSITFSKGKQFWSSNYSVENNLNRKFLNPPNSLFQRGNGIFSFICENPCISVANINMTKSVIKIENIKKNYDKRVILEIPHLEFESGMIYALVGPNGAGKTTLLRILNLLEQSDEGEMYFDGQQIKPIDFLSMRRQMTLVMQNAVLFRTSVFNNVAYGLKVRSSDKNIIHSSVLSALDLVRLTGFEHRKAKQLSAGETQRVALARALVLQPKILLLDEPTANIDKRNVSVIESVLRKVNSEFKTTIIFTTHDLSQAYRMTDKIISLHDGRIMDGGSENTLYGDFDNDDNRQSFINVTPTVRMMVEDYKADSSGIYIDPKDINISFKPQNTNELNCLEGHVTSITMVNGMIRLTINVGIEMSALIKPEVFQEIAPNIFNQSVYAVFKVSDAHVF
jgi:tungstate transport system ATP-binding protein